MDDYAIFALDPEGCVISWNPGAERFKGYTESEIKGKHFSVFYPDEDLRAGKPQNELASAILVGRFEDEGWRIRKDGSRFWANVVITPLRDSDGRLVGFAKITRDLTARRTAEERARELAAEAAAHAVSEAKNRELEALAAELQTQAAELEMQTEEAQTLLEEVEEANQLLARALAAAESAREAATTAERRESAARRRAERLHELGVALSLATTREAVADAVIAFAEKAFEAAGVVVCAVTDNQTVLEIIRASGMAAEVFEKWKKSPLVSGTPLGDVALLGSPVILESLSDWEESYPQLLPLVKATTHRAQIVVPLIAGAHCIGSIGVAFNEPRRFTAEDRELATLVAGQCAVALERARLFEAERASRQLAENANRAKGEFLAAMSHELRTPLNAIAGHVDLLSMGIYGPVTEPQGDALFRVKRAQQHLLRLIDDLLNFARIEGGKVEYRIREFSLQEALSDVAPLIGTQVDAKGLSYSVEVPDAPIDIRADREKLVQVILNLLSNAVKFTDSGGSITVRSGSSSRSVEAPGIVELRISDTGVGIPGDKLQAIFDPFVQLETAPSLRHEGTGLGLAISRELARGMGGDLKVESEVGKGTTFVVELPLAVRAAG